MYQEEIAKLTAKHLKAHIGDYLEILQKRYPDAVKLQIPKAIETDNLVGGVYNTTPENMPAYAVDIISKSFSENTDNLWLYNYEGHIAGVVTGNGEVAVNALVKRHEQATEMFVKQHEFMHVYGSQMGNDFKIHGLGFSGAAFSGAELVSERQDREVWIAGFRIDLLWIASEDGPGQHADS